MREAFAVGAADREEEGENTTACREVLWEELPTALMGSACPEDKVGGIQSEKTSWLATTNHSSVTLHLMYFN